MPLSSPSEDCNILRPDSVVICSHYAASAWLSPFSVAGLRPVLRAMLEASGTLDAVELHLVDDAVIAALNGRHMGAPGPTNALSFPGDGAMTGALFLSLDTFARECGLYGQGEKIHFLRLLAHGLGHLCGFDHGEEMAAIEDRCLRAGIAALAER